MKKYSYQFREHAVKKALDRDPDVPLIHIATSVGVHTSTLKRWLNEFENQSYSMDKEKSPGSWTAQQKFEIVMECESMEEQQISAHCREKGVYPHQVRQWKAEFLKLMSARGKAVSGGGLRKLREENRSLEKQIRRKDKALAEAAALLVLKKKAEQMWGTEDD